MQINENIYGAANTWLNSYYLADGDMKAKCARFNSNNTLSTAATLGAGNTANKTPHNALIDGSVCFTALGNESYYSRLCYVNGADIKQDNEIVTPFFYCENDREYDSTTNIYISDNYKENMWKVYSDIHTPNLSDHTVPIVELNPKKIVYILQIICCDANGVEPSGGTRWRFYGTYARNASSIKTNYPYIKAARLNPRIDNGTLASPNRVSSSTFSDRYQGFGIGINREFTNIQNSNYKINYAMYRAAAGDYCSIMLYGMESSSLPHPSDYYDVLLCDTDDIVFDSYTGNLEVRHEATDDFLDNLIRQAACFGVYFRAYDHNNDEVYRWDVATGSLDSPAVFLGLLDEQGIGHGDYTSGADNVNNPIWNWSSYSQSPYDWTKPVDPTPYNKQTVFGSNGLINTFIQYWALSPAALTGLCDKIYDYIDGLDPDTVDINQSIAKTFYTNNPLDVIVSLKRLPFDITQYSSITGTAQPVKLGNLSLFDITGYKLNGQYTVVDFGSYHIYPKFGNTFLDYAPYTYFELIIPFCGSTRIDPALFMDKTLKLKMVVDLYTGACTCYILADNLCIDSVSGNCAIDIPVSGIQSADFQNSVQNAITNVKNARINSKAFEQRGNLAVGSIGKKIFGNSAVNVGNVLSNMGTSLSSALSLHSNITSVQQQEAQNAIDVNQAEYNLQHVQTPFNSVGSQSAANSYVEEMQARLIIYRPKFADGFNADKYAKTIGHACLINGKVSDFSGLTVGNINTDGIVLNGMSPTDTEKTMLKSLFAGGVIL